MTTENQTIFAATPAEPVATPQVTPTTPTLPQEVAELVGPGKKYASVDEALKSVPFAQKHIQTLTDELKAAKEELEKRRTAEQLLDEIKKSGMPNGEPPSPEKSFSPDKIVELVQQTLLQEQQKETATNNVSLVRNAFNEKFGDKAVETYESLAKENGLTISEINRLAATSPKALLKLAGIEDKKTVQQAGKLSSSVNTEGLKPVDDTSVLSARVKPGASTRDLVAAWKIAGQKVGKPN